ncbi:MAG TPA: Na-translocating system protein MpsC family protein [Solirubrobacterales bacterium]|nr:Na-translocating system protein MpsC family protein [Solirubrobacterales bacterium]
MEAQERTGALADVSRELVRLHSEYYGKGPTRAKAYMVDDTLVCLLEGGFTTVERTLIDEGEADAVHDIRRSFQQAMEGEFTKVVESATQRKVIAYMSQIHHDPDLAVEVFVLEPAEHPVVDRHEVVLEEAGRE